MNTAITNPDGVPPSAPGALTATGGLGQISLSWGPATDNVGVVKYNVHRSTTPGFTPTTANRIGQPTGTSYVDTGLAAGTYYYKVTAEDAAGNVGPASNEASATATADTTAPTVPSLLIATPGSGQVGLTLGRLLRRRRHRQLQRPPLYDRRLHPHHGEPDRTADGNELLRRRSASGHLLLQGDRPGSGGQRQRPLQRGAGGCPGAAAGRGLRLRRRQRYDRSRPVGQRQHGHDRERDLGDDGQVRQGALLQRHECRRSPSPTRARST